MIGTITQFLQGLGAEMNRAAIANIVNPIGDRMSSHLLNSAGLAIKTGGSAIVKTGATAFYGIAKGVLVTKAAATDMPALVGTVTNATFNVYAFYIDSNGTVTSAMGTGATAIGRVKFPPIPVGAAPIGFIIVNPTGTGNFVGGTTALDDATVVPNVVYVNTISPFDPTILI